MYIVVWVFGIWGNTIISEHSNELVAMTLWFGVPAGICDVFWMILFEQVNLLFHVVPDWCKRHSVCVWSCVECCWIERVLQSAAVVWARMSPNERTLTLKVQRLFLCWDCGPWLAWSNRQVRLLLHYFLDRLEPWCQVQIYVGVWGDLCGKVVPTTVPQKP